MTKFGDLVEQWNQWLLYGKDSSSMISSNFSISTYDPNTDIRVFILLYQQQKKKRKNWDSNLKRK